MKRFEDHVAAAEQDRLLADQRREANWKRWGPYLSERQWGTVREDYSPDGNAWTYFPHDHARSRTYRWGEDGLLGITDRQGRLCFALALWNEEDPFLKERLFGLSGPEGNHGEDVKELYFYLDSTPTHSYMKGLYKYPQREFPYERLREENRNRHKHEREFELLDAGVFDDNRYFDVFVEYAKSAPNDILIRITAHNRGPASAPLHILPTLWFRNTWSLGRSGEGYWPKPRIDKVNNQLLTLEHASLGNFSFVAAEGGRVLLTDNETNHRRVFGTTNEHPYVKDSFHDYVVDGQRGGIHPGGRGTKAAIHYQATIEPNQSVRFDLRLSNAFEQNAKPQQYLGEGFETVFRRRQEEADAFYAATLPKTLNREEANVARQGYAGLLWTKQFYHYSVRQWLEGDPNLPRPPAQRQRGRNREWSHLYNRDIMSMPDKWEYPWYAAWDLAFHMIPFARIDEHFAKEQLLLMLREWYMHPNGQMPAYEYSFSDVNPPVHAWAAWRVYKMTGNPVQRDRMFLARVFHKLLLNFTWWTNRKDREGNHIFTGGFLGLDNIGVFDRSRPSPLGGHLAQADATGWMGFFCATMLSIALELACHDRSYEDVASKFFEHFVAIADAMNKFEGTGLWDEEDGFYYDQLHHDDDHNMPLKIRSMVGLIPLMTVEVLDEATIECLPEFKKRMKWFLENRRDLAQQISYMDHQESGPLLLLAIPSRRRLERLLRYVLDEDEFLSPFGIRSLSRVHRERPFVLHANDQEYKVEYVAGESDSHMFGGNSNWRGPVWFPLNFLIIEALERYHYFFGDSLQVECPTGSGQNHSLKQVAAELATRLSSLFLPDASGQRPSHGGDKHFQQPHFKDFPLFYEYFDGDTGRGLGASHQTGWTSLVIRCLEKAMQSRIH